MEKQLAKVLDLFARYIREPERDARVKIACENPLLLSAANQIAILAVLERRDAHFSSMNYFAELDWLRDHLAKNPVDYPIFMGPVARLWREYEEGRLSINDAIQRAGLPEITEELSPVYIDTVRWQASRLGPTKAWRTGVLLCRLLAEATLAAENKLSPIGPEVTDTVTTLVYLTCLAFARGVDDVLYGETLGVLERWIAWAQRIGDKELLGTLYHALGVLHSDPYTIPRTFDSQVPPAPILFRDWVERPKAEVSVFPGLPRATAYPPPAAALWKAVGFFEQALPFRVGPSKGLTYKAIAQALWVLSGQLEEAVDQGNLKAAILQAHSLLLKHPDPTHLATINEMIAHQHYEVPEHDDVAGGSADASFESPGQSNPG
jgi:hypothetical protein